jgi:transcriptional antiterminator NusG
MGYEGNVEAIDDTRGRLTVVISIFGRSTPVELEFWQVEPAV